MGNTNAATRHAANFYIGSILIAGLSVLVWSVAHWQTQDPRRFSAYLIIACLASGMKVVLPAVNGTMSSHFLFVLIGIVELSSSETILMACAAILVQSFWHAVNRPQT